jgi:ATP-dependent 26S proteasome regulatory subunit
MPVTSGGLAHSLRQLLEIAATDRADILETALADRPGRVDLAIEIPGPEAGCRERLFRVYIRDLAVDADLDPVVAGTEGDGA